MNIHHTNYDELARKAEAGELHSIPGNIVRGPKAADLGRALLEEATGASTFEGIMEATMKPGRPRLDEPSRTASPTVAFRLDPATRSSLAEIAKQKKKPESVILREALSQYLAAETTLTH